MKTNIKFMACAILISTMTWFSCEDKLDLKPFNELETSIALNTPADFENLMRGAYQNLLNGGYYGGEWFIRPDILSDNLIISQAGRQTNSSLYRFQMTAESGTWSAPVTEGSEATYNCNLLLENIDGLTDEDLKTILIAEAKTLRALVHFDMARVLCKSPAQASGSELGVYYKTDLDIFSKPARGTLDEVYTSILEDLESSAANLPESSDEGRINKYAAYGLIARVKLYQGDWAGARDAALEAMAGPAQIATLGNFADVWTMEGQPSNMLLRLPVLNADNISIGVVYKQQTRAEYVPDFGFYNTYASNDVRKDAYFETANFEGNVYNLVNKYAGRDNSPADVVDAPVLRIEEVVLTLAEAYANIPGNDAAALSTLDMLRTERYSGFVSGGETGAALMDAIKLERRLELAFEGHRAFDLKRWGEGFTRSNNGELADGTGTTPQADYISLAASDHRFQWPIAQIWLNINENYEQNPGY